MINIKCKRCGWVLPFSAIANKDSGCNRGSTDIVCQKCGEILVKQGGKKNQYE